MINNNRRSESPPSLLGKKTYRDSDVLEALFEDFNAKCYLCESPVEYGSFEVDHRWPTGDGGDIYAWLNLFPICSNCNIRRKKKWPEGGLMFPDGKDDVETRLSQELINIMLPTVVKGITPQFHAISAGDISARNTSDELSRIYDSKSRKGADLISAIDAYSRQVLKCLVDYQAKTNIGQTTDPEMELLKRQLQNMVSRKAPYTALIRSLVKDYISDLFD